MKYSVDGKTKRAKFGENEHAPWKNLVPLSAVVLRPVYHKASVSCDNFLSAALFPPPTFKWHNFLIYKTKTWCVVCVGLFLCSVPTLRFYEQTHTHTHIYNSCSLTCVSSCDPAVRCLSSTHRLCHSTPLATPMVATATGITTELWWLCQTDNVTAVEISFHCGRCHGNGSKRKHTECNCCNGVELSPVWKDCCMRVSPGD